MFKIIKSILPFFIKKRLSTFNNLYINRFHIKSYSQEGEDLILNRIFELQKNGFYIDIGAHHPFRFSNTYLFYKRGWSGINVDAMPNSMKLFDKFRARDINLEYAVGNGGGSMTYYVFNEPALNGFHDTLKDKYNSHSIYKLINKIDMDIKPLSYILDRYMPPNTDIDFLSIDVEGLDFDVLISNNWDRYRPKIILIESWNSNIIDISNNDIYKFLVNKNYTLYAKTMNTLIWKAM